MPTIKYIVRKKDRKKDGSWNVKIRITQKRKSAFISTPVFVNQRQINKKYEITDNFLRLELDNMITDMRKKILEIGSISQNYTAAELAAVLRDQLYNHKDPLSVCIIDFGCRIADQKIQSGSTGTGKLYHTTLNHIKSFTATNTFTVDNITVKFLEKFQDYLHQKNITPTGINLYMRTFRAIFNAARHHYNDHDRNIILIPHYPFERYRMPQPQPSAKRALTPQTIRAIRDANPVNKREILARDVFMLSFYLIGINTIDLYNCTTLTNNRIVYERTKTRTRRSDSALISIAIQPEALHLINKYRDPTAKRVFSFYNMYADRSTFNANINKGLKKIGELPHINVPQLNTYYARHSWATIARNLCAISKDDIAICLNHASQTNRVTDIYIQKDFSIIDHANRKVLNTIRSATPAEITTAIQNTLMN